MFWFKFKVGGIILKKINAEFIVVIGVVFVSFSSILVKASSAPPIIIATYRLMFTIFLIAPSALSKSAGEFKKLDRQSFILCILSGVLLALHLASWVTSIKYTSIASAAILVNTHPIFVVILSFIVFNDRINRKALISIILTLVGGVIISAGDRSLGNNIFLGDSLAVLGAAFISGYMMIGRVMRKKLSVTAYTFIVYLSSTMTLLILVIVFRIPLYPYELKEWAIFLALAVFCTILGHSIFNWALEFVRPTFLSIAMLGEPVFASIWAAFIFFELPSAWNIAGSCIIIIGIYMFSRAEGRK